MQSVAKIKPREFLVIGPLAKVQFGIVPIRDRLMVDRKTVIVT